MREWILASFLKPRLSSTSPCPSSDATDARAEIDPNEGVPSLQPDGTSGRTVVPNKASIGAPDADFNPTIPLGQGGVGGLPSSLDSTDALPDEIAVFCELTFEPISGALILVPLDAMSITNDFCARARPEPLLPLSSSEEEAPVPGCNLGSQLSNFSSINGELVSEDGSECEFTKQLSLFCGNCWRSSRNVCMEQPY